MKHGKPTVRIINIKDPTGLIISGPRTAAASGLGAPGDHYETEQDTEGLWRWWVPSERLAQEGEKRWQEQMAICKRVMPCGGGLCAQVLPWGCLPQCEVHFMQDRLNGSG